MYLCAWIDQWTEWLSTKKHCCVKWALIGSRWLVDLDQFIYLSVCLSLSLFLCSAYLWLCLNTQTNEQNKKSKSKNDATHFSLLDVVVKSVSGKLKDTSPLQLATVGVQLAFSVGLFSCTLRRCLPFFSFFFRCNVVLFGHHIYHLFDFFSILILKIVYHLIWFFFYLIFFIVIFKMVYYFILFIWKKIIVADYNLMCYCWIRSWWLGSVNGGRC